MIADYLAALDGALGFDPALSNRVRHEVEDHLREAVAADPDGDVATAERRAVARFGAPQAIAAQFAEVALAQLSRRLGIGIILAIGAVLLAMKGRVAWYAMTPIPGGGEASWLGATVLQVDRWAFWAAVALGIAAWAGAGRVRFGRFLGVCIAAIAALAVSVTSDGVLTAMRFAVAAPSAQDSVPLVSMLVEIGCTVALAGRWRGVARHARATRTLLGS